MMTNLNNVHAGDLVEVSGMVHNVRVTKWGGFIILRKSRGLLQTVVSNESSQFFNESGEAIAMSDLCREMAVTIKGTVNEAKIKDPAAFYNTIEIAVAEVKVLSRPSTTEVVDMNALKFGDEETLLRFKFDNRQVTLRNPRDMAILKVASVISKAFADYLTEQDFTQIYTPKIVSEGAEGGANVFKMDYFGKQVYLAQSPQFYKQIGVGVYERVFEIAPAYRAEKHNTSRHLNEYISLDVEMGFIKGQEDVMALEAHLLRAIIDRVSTVCKHELELLGATMPLLPTETPDTDEHTAGIPTWKLSRVHEILWENHLCEADHRGEDDLAPEEERAICKYALDKYGSDFVFVTHFPSEHRAFYAMDDPKDPSLTLSFDLLMRGLEITSGGQRIHKEAEYREKMIRRGMNPDAFHFYLDTFKNGMPPHGGFAIGLERITACFLGIANVKECSMFPRDINRVAP
ncbi:MAG: aspartate--tRNA(Asn) ligase [Paludibacteraceae bacterium]|nr:aspartate--tRNA(Asn) ligase [Paludibacteraceae bacterium]